MTHSEYFEAKRLRVVREVSLTNPGRVRKNNEDTIGAPDLMPYLFDPHKLPSQLMSKGRLYAVADGMGGLAKGETASQMALETLFKTYYTLEGEPLECLKMAVAAAKSAVYQFGTGASENQEYNSAGVTPSEGGNEDVKSKVGTTLVVAFFLAQGLLVCNIGDSRAYLFRAVQLSHLTRNHSVIAEGIQRGLFTEEQAKKSPFRNVLTRAVGQKAQVEADYFEHALQAGDVVLLCSDGLYGRVEDRIIEQHLLTSPPLQEAAQSLIELANASGGPDNISVIVVQVAE